MKSPKFILASASPRRRELLHQLGMKFRVVPADVPEVHNDHLTVCEICRGNAFRKARTVAKAYPRAVVLGADTLVHRGRRIFGKPAHRTEARAMLRALSGHEHEVVTACCLFQWESHRYRIFSVITEVVFRKLTTLQIRRYLNNIDPLDKAGAYAVQDKGEWIVETIHGSFTNIVGLPLKRLEAELQLWGED